MVSNWFWKYQQEHFVKYMSNHDDVHVKLTPNNIECKL